MADVIATETGVKKVSVAVVNDRYVISVPATYRLYLSAPVDPFPVVPAFQSVSPPSTDEQAQVFVISGTLLDQIAYVRAYVDGIGETPDLFIAGQSSTEILVANAILELQLLGAVVPFNMVFRGFVDGLLVTESDPVLVLPASTLPTIQSVSPPSTDDINQVFTITGTNLNNVVQLTVEDDVTLPSYYSVPYTIVSPTEISVPAGPIQTLLTGGSVVPFSFRFRIWDIGAPRGYSSYINVTLPLDPLQDAFYTPYGPGPGQVEVIVGSHSLQAQDAGVNYGPVSIGVPGNSNESYTFAVWHRHTGGLPLDAAGYFAMMNAGPPSNVAVSFYNGAVLGIQGTVSNGIASEYAETAAGAWPPYATDPGWHLTVLVRDANAAELRLYVDGVLISWVPALNPGLGLPPQPLTFQVGGWPPGFDATQATGAVWLRALNDTEISELFTTTSFPP